MTKADLKTGMVLICRNGERYRVFRDVCTSYTNRCDEGLDVVVSESCPDSWDYLEAYDDELRYDYNHYEDNSGKDVVAIEMVGHPYTLIHTNWHAEDNVKIYPKKPKYTYDELKKILGHDFELVTDAASCG